MEVSLLLLRALSVWREEYHFPQDPSQERTLPEERGGEK